MLGPGVPPGPEVHRRGAAVVVAAVWGGTDDASLALIAQGYDGVLDLDEEVGTVGLTVRGALGGQAVMPLPLARRLAAGMVGSTAALDPPSRREAWWLARLADGVSVLDLAESEAVSERAMYRRLAALYSRLGARSRGAAIARAARAGWLDDATRHSLS